MPTGALTKAGAELLLNRLRNTGSNPTQVYVGLATSAVSASSTLATVAEVTTAGYARQPVTLGAPSGTDPVVLANTGAVTFGPFSADPPAVGFAFLTDDDVGTEGTILARWSEDSAEDAATSESLQIPIGSLVIGIDTSEAAV
jgi:hypothetical protein